MVGKTRVPRAVAHAITTYGFEELQRRIASDRNRTPDEKIWAHIGALAAQIITHVTIEVVGNYFESTD